MLRDARLAFFASLAMNLEPVERPDLPTYCATDGKHFFYNPKLFEPLPLRQQIYCWAHEPMHAALGHLWRIGTRERQRWNMAGDYAINGMLEEYVDEGLMEEPPGVLYRNDWKGKSEDWIYDHLPAQDQDGKDGEGQEGGGQQGKKGYRKRLCRMEEPAEGCEHDEGRSQEEGFGRRDWERKVIQAATAAQEAGTCPGWAESLVDALRPKQNPWDLVRYWLGQREKSEYKWHPPNRRYQHLGWYLPQLTGNKLSLAFVVDTSGSMAEEDLAKAVGILNARKQTFPIDVRLLMVDERVCGDELYPHGKRVPQVTWKGRGGTNLQNALNYLAEKNYDLSGVVVLTDGWTFPSPLKKPARINVPFLWLFTSSYGEPNQDCVKFGMKVRVR